MSEPTTPTARRLLSTRTYIGGTGMGHAVSDDIQVPTSVTAADLAAIEAEAREQGARAQRERLREAWTKAATEHFLIGTYSDRIVLALLAAPDR